MERKSRLACNGCPKGGVVILNYFLEQPRYGQELGSQGQGASTATPGPRRDNTHEAQLTPYKAIAAVWGEDAATVAASRRNAISLEKRDHLSP